MISKSKPEATRSAADGGSLGRARRVLGSIGERLLEAFTDSSAQEAEHKQRLRGVLLRDRELLADDHDRMRHGDGRVLDAVPAPAAPSAPASDAAPPQRIEASAAARPAPSLPSQPPRPSAPATSASSVPRPAAAPWPAPPPAPKRPKSPDVALQAQAAPPALRPAATPASEPMASASTTAKSVPVAAAAPSAPPPAIAAPASGAAGPTVGRATEEADSVVDEPIRTRSMARLLAGQGHHRRALAIYDALLAQPGADSSLQAEADALRSRLAT